MDLEKAQDELYAQTQMAMQQQIAQMNQLMFSLFEKLINNNWEMSYIPSIFY